MTRLPSPYKGHDIRWSDFQTPRTCSGFYVEKADADRWVFRAVVVLAAVVVVLFSTGVIQ